MKRLLLLAIIPALLLQQGAPTVAQTPNALNFFKNYFITGDYVEGGVGLNGAGVSGVATGAIPISGVPSNTDIVAAFLYWQVVTNQNTPNDGSVGVRFKGHLLSSDGEPIGKVLGTGTPPCWSGGGGTGSSNGSKRTFTYRSDVLRFFDLDPATGRLAANGSHEVQVPDGGGVEALGASLVVIYRNPTDPYRAIVLYEGAYTMDQSTEGMHLTIKGFYDSVVGSPAKLTHIVGSGQANKSEILRFNGTEIATNPFQSSLGPQWDNVTRDVTAPSEVSGQPGQVTTSVDHAGFSSFDCLTWAAVIYRTEAEDSDNDGLLNLWESSTTPILDPRGEVLPNLHDMGADPDVKDVFIEAGYMFAQDDPATEIIDPPSYGGVSKPAHSHRPSNEAVKLMGDAFWNAPTGRITLHFDLGAVDAGSYPIPPAGAPDYVIRGAGARGGEAINEMVTVCTRLATDPPSVCQYSGYPGTVGWKTGFQFLRDEVLSVTPTPAPTVPPTPLEDYCDAPGYTCTRRFDRTRKDIFHYSLFAHNLGLPESDDPENPLYHVPRTNTGVGDFPGGDMLITLGAFTDTDGLPGGTPFMVASTLMHEFGHNVERRHGGEPFEPNCKPSYLSVMNYLYQLRGLLDDAGKPHLDFSAPGILYPTLNETSLTDGDLALPYRIGWYAPLAGSYLEGRATEARAHCNGSAKLLTDPAMVRIDARYSNTATSPYFIDWNANALSDSPAATAALPLDINFSGSPDGDMAGSDDWSNLRLNQIGSRRNVGILIPGTGDVGPASLDLAKGDYAKGDYAKGDYAKGDYAKGDYAKGDYGKGDYGGGDLFQNDPINPAGELDFTTASALMKAPPNEFSACVVGVGACVGSVYHGISARWTTTNEGGVDFYTLYRVAGDTLMPGQTWTPVAQVFATAGVLEEGQIVYRATDGASLLNGASYTYFAVATYQDAINSDQSNLVTIAAVNDPPVAGGDSYSVAEDTTLDQAAPGVLGNDDDPDTESTLTAILVSGPSHGTLALNANGSFTYTPNANYNGSDSFAYKANDGTVDTGTATVTLTVTPVNDAPTMSDIADRTIDGNTSTGAVSFTIGDETPASAIASGSSSNTTLVPAANIVFGGTGATRTVTVTPAPNKSGTATITVTVTDSGGLAASDTFVLTVRQVNYTFVGVQNVPPPSGKTFKAGSAVPMKWQFKNGSTVVDSAQVAHTVTVRGPLPAGPIRNITNTDPGSSSFRYDATTKTWQFNLQTKEANGQSYPVGFYEVTITPATPGFLPSPTFQMQLVK